MACDVETVFVQAAAQFGPQKGATPDQVVELERRLEHYAGDLAERYGVDVTALAGSGAAGGLAGGLAAWGARLVAGFGVVAEAVGLEARLARAQVVVTGEGRLDASSWSGKVVGSVVGMARRAGVPVLVVPGAIGPGGLEPVAGPGAGRPGLAQQDGAVVEVRSLTDSVGEVAARADPARAAEEEVASALLDLVGGRAGPG